MSLKEKILLICLILPLLTSIFLIDKVAASPTKVSVDPPVILDPDMVPGMQFTVNITVDYVDDLWAWQFSLLYNPAVLRGIDIEVGSFLGSAGGTVSGPWPANPQFDNTEGKLPMAAEFLAAFLMENDPDLCPDGGGVLASITFEVVSLGGSRITLGPNTGLVDAYGDWLVGGMQWDEQEEEWSIVAPTSTFPTDPKFLGHGNFDTRPQLYVDPAKVVGLEVGENFTINVDVVLIDDLYSWSLTMNWTSGLLNATDATEGTFLSSEGQETTFTSQLNNTAGSLDLECTIVGDYTGVSGNGTLFSTTFIVIGEGITDLGIYETSFLNSSDGEIPVGTAIGKGSFNNAKFHNVGVTSITVDPTTVEVGSGDIVSVNVTVMNTGSFQEQDLTVTASYDGQMIEEGTIDLLEADSNTTLMFTWNTTGLPAAFHTIKANVTQVEGDVDLEDNTYTYGRFTISGHDIDITSATIPVNVLYRGDDLTITVIVRNEGTVAETFDVTVYYDSVALDTEPVSLLAKVSKTLTFTWGAEGVADGTYSLSVNASAVEGETNLNDNSRVIGTIQVLAREEVFPWELLIVGIVVVVIIVAVAVVFVLRRGKKPAEAWE